LIETAGIALATFFATIGPLDVAAIFAALTTSSDAPHRRSMAIRGILIGAAILLLFALVGEALLTSFGISLAAFRTAGGILLLLIGIDMVFARSSAATQRQVSMSRRLSIRLRMLLQPILRYSLRPEESV